MTVFSSSKEISSAEILKDRRTLISGVLDGVVGVGAFRCDARQDDDRLLDERDVEDVAFDVDAIQDFEKRRVVLGVVAGVGSRLLFDSVTT